MTENRKRSYRKEYLNDFKVDDSGKYSYMGSHMVFQGNAGEWKAANIIFWICAAVPAAFIIIMGFVPYSGLIGNILLIVPFSFTIIGLFIVIWKMVRFSYAGVRMRKYVHKSTALVIPVYSAVTAGIGAMGIVGLVISLINKVYTGSIAALILYILAEGMTAAGCAVIALQMRKLNWQEE